MKVSTNYTSRWLFYTGTKNNAYVRRTAKKKWAHELKLSVYVGIIGQEVSIPYLKMDQCTLLSRKPRSWTLRNLTLSRRCWNPYWWKLTKWSTNRYRDKKPSIIEYLSNPCLKLTLISNSRCRNSKLLKPNLRRRSRPPLVKG